MASISRTPSIYQIRHIESGKVYVGSAVNPRKRWGIHCTVLNQGTHHSSYLQRAWDKYGKDAFVFEVIEPVLFIEDLIAREQYWIDTLRASERTHGFNVTPTAGSVLGVKRSDEYRAKMSERTKAHFADPEQRTKTADRQKARFANPEERAKQSERMKARFADPVYRAKRSVISRALLVDPEERAKVSERAKTFATDPAERAKRSERAKALWKDPEYRARQRAVNDARKKENPL